jgi:hypothetical protein
MSVASPEKAAATHAVQGEGVNVKEGMEEHRPGTMMAVGTAGCH